MKYLMTQEEFEQLIGLQPVPVGTSLPASTVIYFTATWCSACRRLNIPALEKSFPDIQWLTCDVDQNNYTPGYCGVRSIPTFLLIQDKKVVSTFQSSTNEKVEEWLRSHF
ncbi:thioredoxin [bacterium]|nr:thioredoxin [bacterium]